MALHRFRMGRHDAGASGARPSAWQRAMGVAFHHLSELAQDERFWHKFVFGHRSIAKAGVLVTGFRMSGAET